MERTRAECSRAQSGGGGAPVCSPGIYLTGKITQGEKALGELGRENQTNGDEFLNDSFEASTVDSKVSAANSTLRLHIDVTAFSGIVARHRDPNIVSEAKATRSTIRDDRQDRCRWTKRRTKGKPRGNDFCLEYCTARVRLGPTKRAGELFQERRAQKNSGSQSEAEDLH